MHLACLRDHFRRRVDVAKTPTGDRVGFRERIAGDGAFRRTRQCAEIHVLMRRENDVLVWFVSDHEGVVHFGEAQDFQQLLSGKDLAGGVRWIADDDGKVFIYYASSDTRMHVATTTVDRLVDYVMNTPADGYRSAETVKTLVELIDKNQSEVLVRSAHAEKRM